MNFLRNHWYDLGGALALPLGLWLWIAHDGMSAYQLVMWLNLVALLVHQLEEYRVVGTFPGMINSLLYRSAEPERYPLNAQTSLLINVGIGWTVYLLAAVAAERAVWLGMAAVMVSAGNVVAHSLLFNIRGKQYFNAGMITALLFFLPVVIWFFRLVVTSGMADPADWIGGIAAGLVLNFVGVLKMIDWLADPHSPYAFAERQMLQREKR